MGCDQLQSRPPRAGWRSIALRSTVALIRGPTAASCLALSSKDLKRNRDDAEENDPGVFRVVQRIGATHGGEITPLNPSRCVLTIYLWPLQPSKTDESTWIEMRHNEGNSGPKSAEIQGGQVPTPALLSAATTLTCSWSTAPSSTPSAPCSNPTCAANIATRPAHHCHPLPVL